MTMRDGTEPIVGEIELSENGRKLDLHPELLAAART